MKTFHELNEAFPSLLDEDGVRKPFEQFLNDVQKIDNTYNRNYLRAEYNFAHASAQMAARWEQFAADGRMDIKSITKNKEFYGSAIREKNKQLVKYNARPDVHEPADTLCIYFDDPTMFAPEKIAKGYEYMERRTSRAIQLQHIVCIINSAKGLELKMFDFQ